MVELPELRPHTRIAEKIDHHPWIASARCLEDDSDDISLLMHGVFGESTAHKDRFRFWASQPIQEGGVIRLATTRDASNPDSGIFGGRRLRRHLASVLHGRHWLK